MRIEICTWPNKSWGITVRKRALSIDLGTIGIYFRKGKRWSFEIVQWNKEFS